MRDRTCNANAMPCTRKEFGCATVQSRSAVCASLQPGRRQGQKLHKHKAQAINTGCVPCLQISNDDWRIAVFQVRRGGRGAGRGKSPTLPSGLPEIR